MKKIITLALVIMVLAAMPISTLAAEAETETVSVELTTRSVLIIDRSGSIKDQEEVNAIAKM